MLALYTQNMLGNRKPRDNDTALSKRGQQKQVHKNRTDKNASPFINVSLYIDIGVYK